MESTALASLLRAFRERDLSFNQDELTSIVKTEEGRAWVEEYLGHETLLTKDELALYSTLEKSGEAASLADTNDLSIVYPHDDNELKSAIEELQRSTAAIQKQSEILRIQQDALKSLVKSNKSTSEARARADELQQRKWAVEREQLSTEIDEICGGLSQRVAEQLQQRKATDASLSQTTAEFLRADDRLISSLQKLANELEPQDPEDADLSSRLHNLCARLIKFTVQGIRIRLDRIYLEALQGPYTNSKNDSSDAETQVLQEELESLYSEILPVSQMSVEQQYLQPALRFISSSQNQGQDRSARALDYILKCLVFINTRLTNLTTRIQDHASHQAALTYLTTHIQKDLHPPPSLAPPTSKAASKKSGSTSPTKPRRRGITNPTPSKPTSHHKRRSSSNFDYNEDQDPEYLLLRSLGISLPSPSPFSNPQPTTNPVPQVQQSLSSLTTHQKALTSTTETSISSHIQDSRLTLQLLRDSLLDTMKYGGEVRLVDREIEEALEMLEGDLKEVKGARGAIGEGELGGIGGRNVGREEFVGRWGR